MQQRCSNAKRARGREGQKDGLVRWGSNASNASHARTLPSPTSTTLEVRDVCASALTYVSCPASEETQKTRHAWAWGSVFFHARATPPYGRLGYAPVRTWPATR